MTREYKTVGECTRLWVDGFDAIDSGMIEKLMEFEMDDWEEVTLPSLSDRVYVYDMLLALKRMKDMVRLSALKRMKTNRIMLHMILN